MTRVLLVDDAASVRALLRATLGQSDTFEIVGEAATGDEAVALAQRLRPDVVVLDLAMPGMDGLTALPEIARNAPGATIVVFSEAIGDEEAALERGAHAVVHKSDSLELLLGVLTRSSAPAPTPGVPATALDLAFNSDAGDLRRLIIETMSEGLLVIGRDGQVMDANPAAVRILGLSRDRLVGQPLRREVGLPIDVDGATIAPTEVPSIRALLTGEPMRDFILGIKTPHRGLRWLSVNAIPVASALSPTVGVVSTFADVTDQRRAMEQLRESERALRASEERFRAAVEAMPDGLVVYSAIRDDHGRIVDFRCEFANRAAEEQQPRPPAEWIGRTFLENSSNPEAVAFVERYARVVETGEPLELEIPRYVNGEVSGAYESQVVKLHDGFLACYRNVTARKRAEQAVRASERRLFSFFTGLPVGVLVVDIDEGPMFLNPRGRELLGRGLVRGGTAQQLLEEYRMFRADTGEQYPLEDTPVIRAVVTRATCTADDVVIRRENDEVTITVSATPIFDEEARLAYVIVVFDDITERRASGQQLARALADLERSNEELAEFAAVAAHDLSEPLRVVGGFAELVRRKFGERLDAEGNEWLDHVLVGVSRMRGLIDDLLAYSRAGSAPLAMRPVDLGEIVRSVRESLRVAIAEADAVVEVGELPAVVGDPTQLWQVLQNLLANSLKFRRPDATSEITITASRTPNAWRISVTDNGIGVAAADRERIFGPFQRLHVPADRPGSGLGLSICRKIIERHGGRIWVEAAPGGGSRFCFTLAPDPGLVDDDGVERGAPGPAVPPAAGSN